MPKVLMICAMPVERGAAPVGWRVVVAGPGFQMARRAAEAALEEGPADLVVSAGTCGGLRAGQGIGDVYSIARVLCGEECHAATLLAGRPGVLWSQDRVAVSVAEKAALAARGADVVDMEAGAIAPVCQRRGVPFAAMKAVSDLAEEEFPLDFNRYRRADGTFSLPRIAFAGIMKVPGLLRLQQQTRVAVERLGIALANARV